MAVTDIVKEYIRELTPGKPVVQDALGVLPVHSDETGKVEYIT
jgi:hypothetical protein